MRSIHNEYDEYVVFDVDDGLQYRSGGKTAEEALRNYRTEWDAKHFLLMKVIPVKIEITIEYR